MINFVQVLVQIDFFNRQKTSGILLLFGFFEQVDMYIETA